MKVIINNRPSEEALKNFARVLDKMITEYLMKEKEKQKLDTK